MSSEITVEQVRCLMDYNPLTGKAFWKSRDLEWFNGNTRICNSWNAKHVGKEVGTYRRGYKVTRINRTHHALHHLIWMWVYGDRHTDYIDHINGVKDDNRITNLRLVTHQQNMQNQRKTRCNNKLGLTGVYKKKGSNNYQSQIMQAGKIHRLGTFTDPQEAHEAYLKAKKDLHPFSTL